MHHVWPSVCWCNLNCTELVQGTHAAQTHVADAQSPREGHRQRLQWQPQCLRFLRRQGEKIETFVPEGWHTSWVRHVVNCLRHLPPEHIEEQSPSLSLQHGEAGLPATRWHHLRCPAAWHVQPLGTPCKQQKRGLSLRCLHARARGGMSSSYKDLSLVSRCLGVQHRAAIRLLTCAVETEGPTR